MRTRLLPILLAFLLVPTALPAEERTRIGHADGRGNLRAVVIDGQFLPIASEIRIAAPAWSAATGTAWGHLLALSHSSSGGERSWSGRIPFRPGETYLYETAFREDGSVLHLDMQVTAEARAETEGVFFFLVLPVSQFSGAEVSLFLTNGAVAKTTLPDSPPLSDRLLRGDATRVAIVDRARDIQLELSFDRSRAVTIQDERRWSSASFALYFPMGEASLDRGQTVRARVDIRASGEADHTPAVLTVKTDRPRGAFDGFGGNYCFETQSPVTDFTLDTLQVRWARTQMNLREWEPENDNGDPASANWPAFEQQAGKGSRLEQEFLLAQKLQQRRIPYCTSVWYLPEWMYAVPGRDPEEFGRRVAEDKWPELLESVGCYLLYAKTKYGIEPDLFSFNEPDIGVRVMLTPSEYARMAKQFGARFETLGLKTKLLFADFASPRAIQLAEPVIEDAEAMQYMGAVAFHSWGTVDARQYEPWAALAGQLKLPLLIAETGVDPDAWRTPSLFESYEYALRELRMYQHLLLYAAPQAVLHWQLTRNYGIAAEENGTVSPRARYWFLKHFCNLTPPKAELLRTASDTPYVLVSAFRSAHGKDPAHTIHIANLGAARRAVLQGLPRGIRRLRAVRTDRAHSFAELPDVSAARGRVGLDLTPLSLLTLTTVKKPEAPSSPAVKTVSDVARSRVLPPGAPRYSDVCFSSRWRHPKGPNDSRETFRDAAAFHATRLDWVYTADPDWIAECRRRGYHFGGALHPTLPDVPGGATKERGRVQNKEGEPLTVPWLRRNKGWWGCVNSPAFRESFLAHAKVLIDGGSNVIHLDGARLNALAPEWGGCYCRHCVEKRRSLGMNMDDFQVRSSQEFFRDVRKEIDSYAGRHVPFSCNNVKGDWSAFPFLQFEYGIAELPRKLGLPYYVCGKFREAAERGKAQVFTYVDDHVVRTRRLIATAYACGGHIIVPYDVYYGDKPRIFGRPEQYASLYGFARANSTLLDGHEDAAVFGAKLTETRYGKQLPVTVHGGSGDLYAFVRAVPGKADAPVAVHLVEWGGKPVAATVRLRNARFFGQRRLCAKLLVPPPYSDPVHAAAVQSGDFSALSVEVPVETTDQDDFTEVAVPPLKPWGILVVAPGERP